MQIISIVTSPSALSEKISSYLGETNKRAPKFGHSPGKQKPFLDMPRLDRSIFPEKVPSQGLGNTLVCQRRLVWPTSSLIAG